MKAGQLTERITIERPTGQQSTAGSVTLSWAPLVTNRSARMRPLRGDEKFKSPMTLAAEQIEFTVRWAQDVRDVAPTDRIVLAARTDRPEQVYDIVAAFELGHCEGLRLITTRSVGSVQTGGGVKLKAICLLPWRRPTQFHAQPRAI